MKKLIISVGMLILATIIGPGTILASTITDAIYQANIRATNASYTATHVAAPFTLATDSLLDGQYIDSSFSNVTMRDSSGQDVAFMPGRGSDPWIMWIEQIAQNSAINYNLYTGGETAMGGKLAYFPDTAGMTIADAASLELGNSFEIELSGYFSEGICADKSGAIMISTDSSDTLSVFYSGSLDQQSLDRGTINYVYSTLWNAQTFTPSYSGYITAVSLWGARVGTVTGDATVYIYATADGKPTGSALTSTSFVASTWSTSEAWHDIAFNSPIYLEAGTVYSIVLAAPGGTNSSNGILWRIQSSDVYAGGTFVTSNNSGSTWTIQTKDASFKTYISAAILSAEISQPENIVTVTLSGGATSLYINGVLADSAAFAGSVPDNANNWVIGANGSMPYLYYAKITVGGVLKGSWAWQNSATFTDLSGNGNDATPSFRTTTTDADVSVSVISYTVCNQSAFITGEDDEAVEIVTDDDIGEMPDGWYGDLHPENLPGGQAISDFLENMDFPPAFFWYSLVYLGAAIVTMVSLGLTSELLPCAAAGLIWQVFFCAIIGTAWWVLLPEGIIIIGEMVNRKLASY